MQMEPDKTKPEGFLGGLAQRLDKMEFDNDKIEKDMKDFGPNMVRDAAEHLVGETVAAIIEAIIDGN